MGLQAPLGVVFFWGFRVEESSLRGHVWNGQGWVQGSLAVAKSKRLAQLTANLDEELSQIFTSLGAWDIFFMWPLLFGELPGVTG